MSSLLDTNFDIDLNAIAANRINRIIELDYSRIIANNCYNTPTKNWKFINYKPNKNIETYVLCQKTILKDDNVISNQTIDESIIKELKNVIDFDNLQYFACQEKNSRVDIDAKDITKINISFSDNLVAKRAVLYINDKFKGKLKAYILFHKNQIPYDHHKMN